ncbi:MAG TPA: hypothetical protein VJY62_08955, partial [Bacteroidia bacterium]|nr:hypothetical protein [Bacteroidia bacterium]
MKKQIIIIIIFILTTKAVFSQWQWAKQQGGNLIDFNRGTVIDANNNVYCSGTFEISCFFDNDTLNSNGYNDMFLAKYDASGNELWTKRFGGNNSSSYYEYGGIVLIDNNNNCLYYVGHFEGILTIDSYTVNSATGATMFLAKFDLSGNCQWLLGIGSGSSNDLPGPVILDVNNNIYFTGVFGNNGTLGTFALNKGCFLSKLDANGNILWARDEITGGYSTRMKILNNYIILSGICTNDTTVVDTATLITQNGGVFLAQIDTGGNYIHGKSYPSNLAAFPLSFELDAANNVYMTGQFTDSINFDGTILSNNHIFDMFFCKFDSNFNLKWAQQTNSSGVYGGKATRIIPDVDGNFYIVGSFSGSATFDTFNLNSSATQDMFVARYDSSGTCIGIRNFGEAEAWAINLDGNGDLIIAGNFI